MTQKIAILIVNGGDIPKQGRWLDLCLEKLRPSLEIMPFQVYLWNNNLNDPAQKSRLLSLPWVTYLEAAPYDRLAHPHAVPLQRLYTLACEQGAEVIVTLDHDAHPLRHDWLAELVTALENGAVLVGVWRDESSQGIAPYVHPSCLATTVDFIERHHLRFDRLRSADDPEQYDTLAHFTRAAQAANLPIYPLHRSNANNIHRLMGGIYGDLIYHHGAGTRSAISFWDEPKNAGRSKIYERMHDLAAECLFTDYERYLNWLRGYETDTSFAGKMTKLQQMPSIASPEVAHISPIAKTVVPAFNRNNIRALAKKIPGAGRLAQKLGLTRRPSIMTQMLRPLGSADLFNLPAGWRVTGPDFIGVGAPKCGTSWWYKLLVEHPQVVINRTRFNHNKELHYFAHFQNQPMNAAQVDLYRQCFATPPGAICGEFSPSYLSYPNCLEHLAQATPHTKILVMLRNPIDRMLSHLNHMCISRARWLKGLTPAQIQFIHKRPFYSEVALHSLYAVGLRRLFRYFERSQVLVLQYERCRQNPAGELIRTYRFLGLHDDYLPHNLQREVNVLPYVLPRYTPEERAHLAAYFADDVRQTAELCPEIDLTLWPDFDNAK